MKEVLNKLIALDNGMLEALNDCEFIMFKNTIAEINEKLKDCERITDTIVLYEPRLDDFAISDPFAIKRDVFEELMGKELEFYNSIKVADVKQYLPKVVVLKRYRPNIRYTLTDLTWEYDNGRLSVTGKMNENVKFEATFKVRFGSPFIGHQIRNPKVRRVCERCNAHYDSDADLGVCVECGGTLNNLYIG